jgi:hypothetical protein
MAPALAEQGRSERAKKSQESLVRAEFLTDVRIDGVSHLEDRMQIVGNQKANQLRASRPAAKKRCPSPQVCSRG